MAIDILMMELRLFNAGERLVCIFDKTLCVGCESALRGTIDDCRSDFSVEVFLMFIKRVFKFSLKLCNATLGKVLFVVELPASFDFVKQYCFSVSGLEFGYVTSV